MYLYIEKASMALVHLVKK